MFLQSCSLGISKPDKSHCSWTWTRAECYFQSHRRPQSECRTLPADRLCTRKEVSPCDSDPWLASGEVLDRWPLAIGVCSPGARRQGICCTAIERGCEREYRVNSRRSSQRGVSL